MMARLGPRAQPGSWAMGAGMGAAAAPVGLRAAVPGTHHAPTSTGIAYAPTSTDTDVLEVARAAATVTDGPGSQRAQATPSPAVVPTVQTLAVAAARAVVATLSVLGTVVERTVVERSVVSTSLSAVAGRPLDGPAGVPVSVTRTPGAVGLAALWSLAVAMGLVAAGGLRRITTGQRQVGLA